MSPEWRWMGAQAEVPETKVQEWCGRGPPSTRHIGRYEVGRTLGEGTSAHVRFARNRDTQEAVAIKIIDKLRISKQKMIKREISTMQLIKHQNVVQLLEVIASKTKVYIVLEYVDGGELFDKIFDDGKLCEEEARKYFQQLIKAVDYCHSRGVYHRDLKPENLLLDGHGNLKVSDFGLSALSQQCSEDGLLHTTCGTPNYVAPEVINAKGYDGAAADVWSCGIILYVLLAGYLPFDEANHITLYQKMNQAKFTYPTWISNEARKLITRILDPKPKTRITIPEILADDWFGYGYTMTQTCERDIDLDDLERVFFDSKEEELEKSRPTLVNAFEIISMSRGLNLSGLFKEQKGLLKKETRFTSAQPAKVIIAKLQDFAKSLGFQTKEKNYRVKLQSARPGRKGCLSIASEVLEVSPSLHIVNMKKTNGDTLEFNDFQEKLRVGLQDVVWNNEEEIGDL